MKQLIFELNIPLQTPWIYMNYDRKVTDDAKVTYHDDGPHKIEYETKANFV